MTTPGQMTSHELKSRLRDLIAGRPHLHYQGSWIDTGGTADVLASKLRALAFDGETPEHRLCTATACAAGWAAIIDAPEGTIITMLPIPTMLIPGRPDISVDAYAQERLELDTDQADWLFNGNRSPQAVISGLDLLIEDPDATAGELQHGGDDDDWFEVGDAGEQDEQ